MVRMMARRRRKPSQPSSQLAQGDTGPDTPAQRAGAVVIEMREDNGAAFRRKFRDHALEILHKRGLISARQRDAGLILHAAACDCQRSPESAFARVYVDASPQPDLVAINQAERVSRLASLTRHIPRGAMPVVDYVCIRNKQLDRHHLEADPSPVAVLQVALDILGNEVGL